MHAGGNGSSYNAAGNNATLVVALTFSGTFTGLKNVYLYAGGATANSGWVQKGTWNTSGPPTVVSLSPSSGSGTTQAFTALYSDPKGTADLATVRILFNTSVAAAHSCYVYYYPATNLLYLENDAGNGLTAGITPGSSATVSSSQCTLAGTGSSYNAAGNNATLVVALTFSATFTGLKNVYLYAGGATANSGWVQKGTWNTSGPPAVVSLSPSSGTGTTQAFTAVYSDPKGTADLATVRILFNTSVAAAHSCYVYYYPATNLLYLENDAGTAS